MGIAAIILAVGAPIMSFLEMLGLQGETLGGVTAVLSAPLIVVAFLLLIPVMLVLAVTMPVFNGVGLIAGLIASIFQ